MAKDSGNSGTRAGGIGFRAGADGEALPPEEIRFGNGRSSLGEVVVASSAIGVVAILVGNDLESLAERLRELYPEANITPGNRDDQDLVRRVVDVIESPGDGLGLVTDMRGTVIEKRIWRFVKKLGSGSTMTLAEIASGVGMQAADRRVGEACTTNRLAIVVPSHRVLGADGLPLSSICWDAETQKAMLSREAAVRSLGDDIPKRSR